MLNFGESEERKDVQCIMFVRNSVLFILLIDKNDRSSQLLVQSGCGSGDGRKRRYTGIYQSSRDVRTYANHFRNLIPLYQPELAK